MSRTDRFSRTEKYNRVYIMELVFVTKVIFTWLVMNAHEWSIIIIMVYDNSNMNDSE